VGKGRSLNEGSGLSDSLDSLAAAVEVFVAEDAAASSPLSACCCWFSRRIVILARILANSAESMPSENGAEEDGADKEAPDESADEELTGKATASGCC